MGRLSLYLTLRHRHRHRSRTSNCQINRSPRGRKGAWGRSVNRMEEEEEEEERRVSKKRKLDDIELKKVLDDDCEAPRELEVVPASEERRRDEEAVDMEGLKEEFRKMSDLDLEEKIRRNKGYLSNLYLSDNGAKLRLSIERMEAECERRKRCKDAYIPESKALNLSGAAAGLDQETPLSLGKTHSQFFSTFKAKLELSDSRATGSCNQPKKISNGQFVSKGEQTSRDRPYQCPTRLASNQTHRTPVNGDTRGSISALLLSQRSLPTRLIQKAGATPHINSVHARGRVGKTVVFLDDEDSELDEDDSPSEKDLHFDDMQRQLGNLEDHFRGSKISYPSRNDPTHVDIDFFDIKCLDPEVYLSSPIMNFYIRHLQQPGSPTDTSRCDYHFFNTFFYSKLKAAVSYKGNNSTSFAKFRRWWKGINIFHKAYILIPVHEDHHWSLIIICIPYKDKEAGPIILHLDSLGLHYSRAIFENIKRFIKEEWEYLTKADGSSDLPWANLPRRIEEKTVLVPQQKNEYDCGVFVLYFMERFIAEAPERLSREDLQMFNKQWFRPAEASALRTKIRNLLLKEFEAAQQVQKDDTLSNQT